MVGKSAGSLAVCDCSGVPCTVVGGAVRMRQV